MEELDLTFVDKCVEQFGGQNHNVLDILCALQSNYGYLPRPALERVCEITEITPASIAGVTTFYDRFRLQPCGQHIIRVCVGTACHVKGAQLVYDAFRRRLDLKDDQDTDADGLFTVEKVACLGCCTLAPAVQIGDVTYGHLTADAVSTVINDFLSYTSAKEKHRALAKSAKHDFTPDGEIRIGLGSCCVARGSGKLLEALNNALEETGIHAAVKHVGCVGMCFQTPLLEIVRSDGPSFLYTRVRPEDAKPIVLRHFEPPSITRRISAAVSATLDKMLTARIGQPIERHPADVRDTVISTFLDRQRHLATEHYGHISPVDIDEHLANNGFEALEKCLKQLTADAVISEIADSRLRGRGGAGYLTHLKWSAVRAAQADQKYVVCNGDEGDPGAFMDRMLMESYPYRIIEGLTIAAHTVGANKGFLYIRSEYPLATKRITEAIEKCHQRNLLGDNIMGTDFSLHLKIVPGAGAFVCGEETALLASIEGRRGMPRLRPPYPAQKGLWGQPTLVNNVETLALVPWIIRNGGNTFAQFGSEHSKGTKVFALAGKVAKGGLIEVPMGITVRQIVEEIGGGIGSGLRFKAVQIGGPSGGCLPAELSDIPVDYESLTHASAIMGSGGLVVLDESDCMVDIARYFLEFTQNQSCGKCTFCRIGTRRMLDILEGLCSGQGKDGDIDLLEQLARHVQRTSLCGLGKTAPNPVLSTITHFRDEYQAHIEKHCPAARCKALITYWITDDCIGCTICAQHCPADAIEMKPYEKHEIDPEKCIKCGTCRKVCPAEAVKVK